MNLIWLEQAVHRVTGVARAHVVHTPVHTWQIASSASVGERASANAPSIIGTGSGTSPVNVDGTQPHKNRSLQELVRAAGSGAVRLELQDSNSDGRPSCTDGKLERSVCKPWLVVHEGTDREKAVR